jgi:hypothetical protein
MATVENQRSIAFACVAQAQAACKLRLDTDKDNRCPHPNNIPGSPMKHKKGLATSSPDVLSVLPPHVLLPWPRSLLPPSQPLRKFLPCQRRPCLPSLVLLFASAQVVKNLRLASFTSWIFIIVKVPLSLVTTVCPPILPTSYLVMNFAAPIFAPSATSRILLVKTNVLDVGSIHAIYAFRKTIM